MSTAIEQAQAELAAAQAKVAALSLVPDADNYEGGTILRWRRADQRGQGVYVAVKDPVQYVWYVTGRGQSIQWNGLVAMYLSGPLEFFEVAPEDWSDARLAVSPPVDVDRDGLTMWDKAGNTWDRHGDQWVLR